MCVCVCEWARDFQCLCTLANFFLWLVNNKQSVRLMLFVCPAVCLSSLSSCVWPAFYPFIAPPSMITFHHSTIFSLSLSPSRLMIWAALSLQLRPLSASVCFITRPAPPLVGHVYMLMVIFFFLFTWGGGAFSATTYSRTENLKKKKCMCKTEILWYKVTSQLILPVCFHMMLNGIISRFSLHTWESLYIFWL